MSIEHNYLRYSQSSLSTIGLTILPRILTLPAISAGEIRHFTGIAFLASSGKTVTIFEQT